MKYLPLLYAALCSANFFTALKGEENWILYAMSSVFWLAGAVLLQMSALMRAKTEEIERMNKELEEIAK